MNENDAYSEVHRAVEETRGALREMALREALAYPLMNICALIDRFTLGVTSEIGDDAFTIDEEKSHVTFRVSAIDCIASQAFEVAEEIGYTDEGERTRFVQRAINQFIVHELIHIRQNFQYFESVQAVKEGFSSFGLPVLDASADVLSAWTCANVECELNGLRDVGEIKREYVNSLLIAYIVGAFVFDIKGRAPKVQRALGLVISAVLVQAQCEGNLNGKVIFDDWRELSPILVLDWEKTGLFNALVVDGVVGLLVPKLEQLPNDLAERFWKSAGNRPVALTLQIAGEILLRLGVISADIR